MVHPGSASTDSAVLITACISISDLFRRSRGRLRPARCVVATTLSQMVPTVKAWVHHFLTFVRSWCPDRVQWRIGRFASDSGIDPGLSTNLRSRMQGKMPPYCRAVWLERLNAPLAELGEVPFTGGPAVNRGLRRHPGRPRCHSTRPENRRRPPFAESPPQSLRERRRH